MGTIARHSLSIVPSRISDFPAARCHHPGQPSFHPWKRASQAHSFSIEMRRPNRPPTTSDRVFLCLSVARYDSKNENPTRRQAYGFMSDSQEQPEQEFGFSLKIEGQISHMMREHYRKMSLKTLDSSAHKLIGGDSHASIITTIFNHHHI